MRQYRIFEKKKLETCSINNDKGEIIQIKETQDCLKEMKKQERKRFIKDALEKMDSKDSLLLSLFYLDEQSVDEISAITDLEKSNVKVKLFRARKRFYQCLENSLKGELKSLL